MPNQLADLRQNQYVKLDITGNNILQYFPFLQPIIPTWWPCEHVFGIVQVSLNVRKVLKFCTKELRGKKMQRLFLLLNVFVKIAVAKYLYFN